MKTFERGEIYLVNMGEGSGSVQKGIRPAIIIQNDVGNRYSPTLIVCPMTSQSKKEMPTHVVLTEGEGGVKLKSIILCEQITIVNKNDVQKRLGKLENRNRLEELNMKIAVSCGLV